jgi:type VI secretion system protein VasG
MSEISRTALFGKLNALCYKAVEGATVFCKLRGNPYVELEHWLAQLLQNQDSDLHHIVRHYGLDASVLAKDLTNALDRLPRGATAISDIAEQIPDAIERAWTYATLKFGEGQRHAQDAQPAQPTIGYLQAVREGQDRGLDRQLRQDL